MKISILGTGCPKCKKLAENAEAAAQEVGVQYELEKVTDIKDIMAYGVMMTPALAIDGKVVASGKPLAPDEIKVFLTGAGQAGESPAGGGCSCGCCG